MASSDDAYAISIADNEIVLRRIPEHWYNPETGFVDPQALTPHKNDTTGLSFGRAMFHGAEQEAAKGRAGKRYYVAVLAVTDVRASGATIVASPLPGDPAHAEIPDLTHEVKRTKVAIEMIAALRSRIIRIEGPFDGAAERG